MNDCKLNKIGIAALFISAILLAVPTVLGVTTIRIEPHAFDPPEPVILSSPATFTVNVTEHTAYDPHILLVMSEACWDGLVGNVIVSWTGGSIEFEKGEFTEAVSGFVPPSMSGADYQASSLKSHLGVPNDESIYWAHGPFLVNPIGEEEQEFTVTIESSATRMLVYAIGKTEESGDFDNRVPNTRPGFVIPEIPLGTVMALAAMLTAMIVVAKRPQIPKSF